MNDFNLQIQLMINNEIEEVQKLSDESMLAFWSRDGIEAEINNPNSICLTVKYFETIIGFLIARLIMSEKCIELYNIAIKPEYQRLKVGTKLLKFLKNQSFKKEEWKDIFLEVRKSNYGAIQFYISEEFIIIGERNNFYSNPAENAVIMRFTKNN